MGEGGRREKVDKRTGDSECRRREKGEWRREGRRQEKGDAGSIRENDRRGT